MKTRKVSVSDNESDEESETKSEKSSIKPTFSTKNKDDIVKNFSKKEICYYKMIHKFFSACSGDNMTKMIDIINGNSSISLRVLDWFVTKYSKKRVDCGQTKESEVFDIRISYKSQLKAYKKRYFDPFRRRKKFIYYFNEKNNKTEETCVETTIGQLNFFKWAISNDIINYVETNIGQITKAMNLSNKEDKNRRKSDEKNEKIKKASKIDKTKNIKVNAVKTTKETEVEIVLTFD